ncbi:MAG: SBBP repeat-containing protein [Bacteroidota bacterium]
MPEKKKYKRVLALFVVLLSISISAYSQGSLTADKFSGVPGFIENKGQLFGYDGQRHDEVKFYSEGGGMQVFLFENGLAYQFTKTQLVENDETADRRSAQAFRRGMSKSSVPTNKETFRIDLMLEGAKTHPLITTEEANEAVLIYANRGIRVNSFNKIVYHDVYPGIDWVIYIHGGQMKYDFIVRPGADPSLIKMRCDHAESLSINAQGELILGSRLGQITDKKPVSFQGEKILGTQFLLEGNIISFAVKSARKNETLIIDPSVVWSTYYSGPAGSWGNGCATDASGNVYLTGTTNSTVSIASGGYQNSLAGLSDAFLAKFSSAGALLWATYYGGADYDDGFSCATDQLGNVYMAGVTTSTAGIGSGGFQNTFGGVADAFLVKFSSAGALIWGTYYGGTGSEVGYSCATDAIGNVYLAGFTFFSSTNIASGGHQNTPGGNAMDAYLVKFNSAGARQWGTYYGGLYDEIGFSCATDNSGNVYLTGETGSATGIASGGFLNTHPGFPNSLLGIAFLVKFNSSGVRQWGTYYGGSMSNDRATSVSTDPSGNVFMAGRTNSSSGIASGGFQNSFNGGIYDAFLVKFNTTGGRLWATYYGGIGAEEDATCVTDASGNVFLAGATGSPLVIASNGFQSGHAGAGDGYIVKFDAAGSRLWGSYLGGSNQDGFIGPIAFHAPSSSLYVSGTMRSSGLAINGYQSSSVTNGNNAFLARICDGALWPSAIMGPSLTCNATSINYSVAALPGATSYTWTLPGGWSGSSATNSINAITATGAGSVIVSTINVCGVTSQTLSVITSSASPAIPVLSGNTSACAGASRSYSLIPDPNAVNFNWILPSGWSGTTTTGTLITVPGTSGIFSVTAVNGCGNSPQQTFSVTVNPQPSVSANSGAMCSGRSFTILPGGANIYTITGNNFTVSPLGNTSYSITGTDINGCVSSNTAVASVTVIASPTVNASSGTICSGKSFTILPGGANTYSITGNTFTVSPVLTSTYLVTGTGTNNCISTNTAVSIVSVNITPTITVNSGTICTGKSFTILPSGANTYTVNGNLFTVSPALTSTYLVTGTATNNCVGSNTAVSIVSVNITPTVSANNGSICSGTFFTVTPSGADTYTITGNNFTVSPALTSTYLVTGTATNNCVSSNTAVSIVSVNITPTVSVNSGSICSGQSFTIIPSGANTYTVSGNSFTVSPVQNNTYLVTGTGTNNCVSGNTASAIVLVAVSPTLSVNSGSICSGQVFTLNPSGAGTYTVTGNSLNVSPIMTSTYLVTGTGTNNCAATNTAVSILTVAITPTVSINSGSICAGQTITLVPSGAFNYTISGGSYTVSPAVSSSYLLQGISSDGCLSANLAVSSITVDALPQLTVNSTATVICPGETVTLTAVGANSYLWNGTFSGAGYITLPAAATIYTVMGTGLNGCVATMTVMQQVDQCVGIIEKVQFSSELKVYPNPANGEFFIETSGDQIVTIVNGLGQTLVRCQAKSGLTRVDIKDLAAGVYFVTVFNGKESRSVRIIVQ